MKYTYKRFKGVAELVVYANKELKSGTQLVSTLKEDDDIVGIFISNEHNYSYRHAYRERYEFDNSSISSTEPVRVICN